MFTILNIYVTNTLEDSDTLCLDLQLNNEFLYEYKNLSQYTDCIHEYSYEKNQEKSEITGVSSTIILVCSKKSRKELVSGLDILDNVDCLSLVLNPNLCRGLVIPDVNSDSIFGVFGSGRDSLRSCQFVQCFLL